MAFGAGVGDGLHWFDFKLLKQQQSESRRELHAQLGWGSTAFPGWEWQFCCMLLSVCKSNAKNLQAE